MTVRSSLGRRAPAVTVMATGAAVLIVGSLLPWLRTGAARRHSYELFALVERLGFAPDGAAAAALRWWPLVPFVVVLAVVGAWWGWPRAGGAIGAAAGLYAGGVGLAVAAAPPAVDIEPGAAVTAAGGLVLLAGSVWCVVVGSQERSVSSPTDRARSAHRAAPPAGRS